MRVSFVSLLIVLTWGSIASSQSSGLHFQDFERKQLLKWKPPNNFMTDFPYFLSGYDEDGIPIWVAEYGKYDPIPILKGDSDLIKKFQMYWLQMFARFVESATGDGKNSTGEFILIADMEGLDIGHISSPKLIQLSLWIAREAEKAISYNWKTIYVVNANYVFTTIWNLVRPLIGQNAYKVNIYGTNKQVWMPKLLRDIPKDQIPEWLGGSKDHRPVQVYG